MVKDSKIYIAVFLSIEKKNIALVLPAYNISDTIKISLLNIKKGIENFPDHNFTFFQQMTAPKIIHALKQLLN